MESLDPKVAERIAALEAENAALRAAMQETYRLATEIRRTVTTGCKSAIDAAIGSPR